MIHRYSVVLLLAGCAFAQSERALEDRIIHYWLLEPESHQFRISHDFTVDRVGRKSVHSFVRKGSVVSKAEITDLNTGLPIPTHNASGKDVNALGYYPTPTDPESVVVQGDLRKAIAPGESTRVRVVETYTDPKGYRITDGELVWDRTLGRPYNEVTLPGGWKLTGLSVPAIISNDAEGRVMLRFTNPRKDEIHVVLRARKR
ncbi:MAG: hypothetical protein ABI823_12925 [Bryobacteraceae bacterium]